MKSTYCLDLLTAQRRCVLPYSGGLLSSLDIDKYRMVRKTMLGSLRRSQNISTSINMLAALRKGYGVDGGATDLVSGLGLQFLKNLLRLGLRCQSHDEDLAQKFANCERLGENVGGDVPWECQMGDYLGDRVLYAV